MLIQVWLSQGYLRVPSLVSRRKKEQILQKISKTQQTVKWILLWGEKKPLALIHTCLSDDARHFEDFFFFLFHIFRQPGGRLLIGQMVWNGGFLFAEF